MRRSRGGRKNEDNLLEHLSWLNLKNIVPWSAFGQFLNDFYIRAISERRSNGRSNVVFVAGNQDFLAIATNRLAEATAQPHVVATIETNQWAWSHVDLRVNNTGNATAYDISISFDPPLKIEEIRNSEDVPLRKISVLRPGHGLSSHLGEFSKLEGSDIYGNGELATQSCLSEL